MDPYQSYNNQPYPPFYYDQNPYQQPYYYDQNPQPPYYAEGYSVYADPYAQENFSNSETVYFPENDVYIGKDDRLIVKSESEVDATIRGEHFYNLDLNKASDLYARYSKETSNESVDEFGGVFKYHVDLEGRYHGMAWYYLDNKTYRISYVHGTVKNTIAYIDESGKKLTMYEGTISNYQSNDGEGQVTFFNEDETVGAIFKGSWKNGFIWKGTLTDYNAQAKQEIDRELNNKAWTFTSTPPTFTSEVDQEAYYSSFPPPSSALTPTADNAWLNKTKTDETTPYTAKKIEGTTYGVKVIEDGGPNGAGVILFFDNKEKVAKFVGQLKDGFICKGSLTLYKLSKNYNGEWKKGVFVEGSIKDFVTNEVKQVKKQEKTQTTVTTQKTKTIREILSEEAELAKTREKISIPAGTEKRLKPIVQKAISFNAPKTSSEKKAITAKKPYSYSPLTDEQKDYLNPKTPIELSDFIETTLAEKLKQSFKPKAQNLSEIDLSKQDIDSSVEDELNSNDEVDNEDYHNKEMFEKMEKIHMRTSQEKSNTNQ